MYLRWKAANMMAAATEAASARSRRREDRHRRWQEQQQGQGQEDGASPPQQEGQGSGGPQQQEEFRPCRCVTQQQHGQEQQQQGQQQQQQGQGRWCQSALRVGMCEVVRVRSAVPGRGGQGLHAVSIDRSGRASVPMMAQEGYIAIGTALFTLFHTQRPSR